MNNLKGYTDFEQKIFDFNNSAFTSLAREIFYFQYQYNPVYHRYVNTLGLLPEQVKNICQIPFLPVSFFKSQQVTTTTFEPVAIFESSGTTQTVSSKHFVKDLSLYRKSFLTGFEHFYGSVAGWCIIALLPSYLERNNSSLVVMADELIRQSKHPQSGFYLNQYSELHDVLKDLERQGQKTILIGVTFALLDFAEQYPMQLTHTIIMETGGMKGRRQEITRAEVHDIIKKQMGVKEVHSEYGMTELLSQAYSKHDGIFNCPGWIKVLVRDEDDPLTVHDAPGDGKVYALGAINIIDFANIYSCSFIATDDAGKLYADGSFEVMGRMDNSDIRGCSLMLI
ncbi:MAG: acyl transferase [Chitinophagaceae bacterium]|nr:acyl transferase [Chitinophagaceae bacterium]